MRRGSRRLAAGAIALALGVGAGAAPAGAACPPLRGAGTWLEQVARQHQGRTTPLSQQEIADVLQRENIAPFTSAFTVARSAATSRHSGRSRAPSTSIACCRPSGS